MEVIKKSRDKTASILMSVLVISDDSIMENTINLQTGVTESESLSISNWQQDQTVSTTYEDPVAADIFRPSPFKASSINTELVVDHTYRDYSGIKPNQEDRRRQANRKKDVVSLLKIQDPTSRNPFIERKTNPEVSMVQKKTKSKAAKKSSDLKSCLGKNFPSRLHGLLSHGNGMNGIITWLPHGRSWIVLDKKRFLERVAPLGFQMSKFESFIRQVNGWGFKRITQGPDMHSYYHELFLKGMPHLTKWMNRVPTSRGQIKRLRASPKDEPNFYEISTKYPIPDHYHENGGEPVSMSLTLGRPAIAQPVIAHRGPKHTMPSCDGDLRRQGGIFLNDHHHHIALQYHAVSSHLSEDQSQDHSNLFEMDSSEGRVAYSPPPSKRMKIDILDLSTAVIGSNVILDHNFHDNNSISCEAFPRNKQDSQNKDTHTGSLHRKEFGFITASDDERNSNSGKQTLGLTREKEPVPPSDDHWKMFCDVIVDREDDHIAVEISTHNSSQIDDHGHQRNDDDDDDSFYRMITESVNFDPTCHGDFPPSCVQLQSW